MTDELKEALTDVLNKFNESPSLPAEWEELKQHDDEYADWLDALEKCIMQALVIARKS